jgi:hypothetical protein
MYALIETNREKRTFGIRTGGGMGPEHPEATAAAKARAEAGLPIWEANVGKPQGQL